MARALLVTSPNVHWQSSSLLLVALVLGGSIAPPSPRVTTVSGFPEAGAAIGTLVLHFDRDLTSEMYPVYRGLRASLPDDVRILMALPRDADRDAAEFLLTAAGFPTDRLDFAVTQSDITVWARDRMVVVRSGDRTVLERQESDFVDGDRQGDLRAVEVLAEIGNGTEVRDEPLFFEGGNVLFTGSHVLVGRNLIEDNLDAFSGNEALLMAHLEEMFGRRPTVLGDDSELPHVHLDMFLTVVGPDTVLLADPMLGADYLRKLANVGLDESLTPSYGSWTVEGQYRMVPSYEVIRRQLEKAGFRVRRIPILHGEPDVVVTWNNALTEQHEDGLRAYVPSYGIPLLDERAQEIYRSVGCRVFPIDVSAIAGLGGTVRCVTNVLDWRVPVAR